jgi:predicted nucleic acid-binding protein
VNFAVNAQRLMPLLVDTGILYVLADRRDAWHLRVKRYLEATPQTLLVTIVPEVAYLLRLPIGVAAERVFVASIADGEVALEELAARDWKRVEALMSVSVDASVVAIAERLKLHTLATTDRRRFLDRPSRARRAVHLGAVKGGTLPMRLAGSV